MVEDNAPKDRVNALKCASCRYDLSGLETQSKCPECGFSIVRSQELADELILPGDELPRIRLAMALLLSSTLTGIPGIMLYCLFAVFLGLSQAWAIPDEALWSFQGLLYVASWSPVLTLAVLPRRVHVDGGVRIMVGWALGCVVGIGLINTPFQTLFLAGSALAVVCGIINLTRANRSIGSVVPAWGRLGAARQTRGPLVAAVLVIAVCRMILEYTPSYRMDDPIPVWIQLMVAATEILLFVGCIYLLINRLWLIFSLWRASALRTRERH